LKRPHIPGGQKPARQAAPVSPKKPARQAAPISPKKPNLKQEGAKLGRLAAYDAKQKRLAARAQRREIRRFTSANRTRLILVSSAAVSVFILVGLVLATMFTPMLAIQNIDVVGTHRVKSATVKNALKSLVGTPLTMVSDSQIQQRLASFPLIESFTTVSLPPHTLQIVILERQPIGIVNLGGTDYLYDPAGVQIEPTKATGSYPRVLVNGDPHDNANYRAAIDVLLAMPVDVFPRIASIQATSKDDVRIRLRGIANQQILWGDSSDSILKSKVLAALMANTKSKNSLTFDVSSPKTPTVRYGNF
jgi:cell division protein FtsQ